MGLRTQAAVVRECRGSFVFEDVVLDDVRPHEMYVRIVACGICHTDVAVRDGMMAYPFPCVLGHEGAGIVEAVGGKVSSFRVGDAVLLSFRSCGRCQGCRSGHPSRCRQFDMLNFSGTRSDGSPTMWDSTGAPLAGSFFGQSSFAYMSLTHERNAIRVDSPDELALFAPLGCGLQAGAGTVLNELKPQEGESIAILGAGSVGLAAVMAARILQAGPIIVTDIVPSRLALAKDLGAEVVIDSRNEPLLRSVRDRIGDVMYVVDTTGNSKVINQALEFLHPRGKISLLAISADDLPLNAAAPHQTVIESIAGNSNPQIFVPRLISLYKEGKFPLDRLIRHYPAEEINTAILDSVRGIAIKPVLRFTS